MDPIHPIVPGYDGLPPIAPTPRTVRVQRDGRPPQRRPDEREPEPEDARGERDDASDPDDEHPHIDVTA